MKENKANRVPSLVLEFVAPGAIGFGSDEVPELLARSIEILRQTAVSPESTRLVVTGDFVASVRSRLGDHPSASTYGTERGPGTVGAKTMPQPDGSVDVIVPAWFFNLSASEDSTSARGKMVLRTILHESLHVAMRQNDQSYKPPADLSWRDLNFRNAADSIVDEYRAEAGVALSALEDEVSWSPVEILATLSSNLGEIVAKYQAHLDVQRLSFEVGEECLVAWRLMAYLAAADINDPTRRAVTVDIADELLWQRMAGDSWVSLRDALAQVPPGDQLLPDWEITRAVEEVSGVLIDWLLRLGFDWSDSQFRIMKWYFEDEDFLRAMDAM